MLYVPSIPSPLIKTPGIMNRTCTGLSRPHGLSGTLFFFLVFSGMDVASKNTKLPLHLHAALNRYKCEERLRLGLATAQCQQCPDVRDILQCLEHRDQMQKAVIRGIVDPALDGNGVVWMD